MKAIWKGHIRFSLVTIPVRIYNAIDTAQTLRFNQLNKNTNNPIRYEKKDKGTDEVVKPEDIVKGFQYEPGQWVIVDKSDFEKVKLKSTKVIEIEGFVNQEEVHPTLFDAPYYAGPDGEVANKAFSLLCETLKETGKLGIGRVVLRDRESIMLIAPHKPGILMYKLRFPDEVRSIEGVPGLEEVKTNKVELKLAKTLVESMSTTLDKISMKDNYQGALRDIINAKVEGKEFVSYEEEEKPVVDIMAALKASIDGAKEKKKPMKKAGATKAKTSKKNTVKAKAS